MTNRELWSIGSTCVLSSLPGDSVRESFRFTAVSGIPSTVMGAQTPAIRENQPHQPGVQSKMNVALLVAVLTVHVHGKLHIGRYDQLDSNLINSEAAPVPSTMVERDWVKIAYASPVIINTRLGERVEIDCEAMGSSTPEVHWLRGERSISHSHASTKPRSTVLVKGKGFSKIRSKLVIDCATRKHEGFYTCAATSGEKTIKAEPTLVLIEGIGPGDLELCAPGMLQPPRIVTWSPTAMLTQGTDLQLPCTALGNPAPSIYWIDPQNNILNSVRHHVSATGELTISNLAWSDMGEYTCVAQSPQGRDEVTTFVYPIMNEP